MTFWKFWPDFVKIPQVKCKPLCYAHGTVEKKQTVKDKENHDKTIDYLKDYCYNLFLHRNQPI